MHNIEPYYNWRHIYVSEEDERSPFFGREYSEFEFTLAIYNYLIHPQWDEFGSKTLYMKVLLADYEEKYVIIELIEEWIEDVEDRQGWVICINMPEQTQYDFRRAKLDRYIGLIEQPDWRIYKPFHLFKLVDSAQEKRLNL